MLKEKSILEENKETSRPVIEGNADYAVFKIIAKFLFYLCEKPPILPSAVATW